jgi:hypothetical protein
MNRMIGEREVKERRAEREQNERSEAELKDFLIGKLQIGARYKSITCLPTEFRSTLFAPTQSTLIPRP